MWRIAPAPEEFFRTAIRQADPGTRPRIIAALANLPEAAPVVIEALDDPSASVRFAALSALKPSRIDDRAMQSIRRLVGDPSRLIREAARTTLDYMEGRRVNAAYPTN